MGLRMPRGIVVADVGYTNTKALLFDHNLHLLAERKIASPHSQGRHYREIDIDPIMDFFATAIPELDAIAPADCVVTTSHGACIATVNDDGTPAVPLMDYMSEPPQDILDAYTEKCPSFAETYSPQLPVALLHAMQLYWQERMFPNAFSSATHILPLMQYVGARLGGRLVTEISAMGCQTHLLDMNTFGPSQLASQEGWASKFAPRVNAWDTIGTLSATFKRTGFRGEGVILAGVHDSNANYLRYLAAGVKDFTLLSTGTWIIGFDTAADIKTLDPTHDLVANADVFGRRVACCRFFGGKEFEIVSGGAEGEDATLTCAARLVAAGTMALPSFTESGGPLPGTGGKGRIAGPVATREEKASLASLYCALMVSESLDAIRSNADIIVDGPFSQNEVFLSLLAALRPGQRVSASNLKDGTAAGAACLALMPDGTLPRIEIETRQIAPAAIDLARYKARWRAQAAEAV
jgi:sugar (pentulose or hexulose) kinase